MAVNQRTAHYEQSISVSFSLLAFVPVCLGWPLGVNLGPQRRKSRSDVCCGMVTGKGPRLSLLHPADRAAGATAIVALPSSPSSEAAIRRDSIRGLFPIASKSGSQVRTLNDVRMIRTFFQRCPSLVLPLFQHTTNRVRMLVQITAPFKSYCNEQ
jgi:hypothetical protein